MTSPESYIGRSIDWDGYYGNQCMDLILQYCADNGLPKFSGNAKDVYGQLAGSFDWVANSPTGVPPAGSIVVWGTRIGEFGHIAIARAGSDTNRLLTVDQNWNGHPYVEAVTHNYNGVLGWGIPKNINAGTPAQGGSDLITPQDRDNLRIINSEVKGWDFNRVHTGQYDDREVQAWVGKSWNQFIQEGWREGEAWRHMRIQKLADYDKLSAQVAELKANPTKAELQAVVDQLSASQSKNKELEDKIAQGQNPDNIVVSRGFFNGLFDKIKSIIGKG